MPGLASRLRSAVGPFRSATPPPAPAPLAADVGRERPPAAPIEYAPAAVSLPADSPVTRAFHDPRSHLPGKPSLGPADYEGYETHGIFHDVFVAADGASLRAIGPPLVNLEALLLPLHLTVVGPDGRETALRHRHRRRGQAAFHEFRLPEALRGGRSLRVRLRFANGLTAELEARRTELRPVFLQLTCLSKDNPPAWLVDWMTHAARTGVERVILYDNGSDDLDGVREAIARAPGLPQVVLVHWGFPFGPLRSYYNRFSHASQNNHVYQCFGATAWQAHFDVDEYLVGRGPDAIAERLARQPPWVGRLRYDSFWVPRTRGDATGDGVDGGAAPPEARSARGYRFRERAPRGEARKYIARPGAVRLATTHNARLRPFRIGRDVAPDEAAFLHYKGLTTGWKTYDDRLAPEPVDPERHVEDLRVVDSLDGAP